MREDTVKVGGMFSITRFERDTMSKTGEDCVIARRIGAPDLVGYGRTEDEAEAMLNKAIALKNLRVTDDAQAVSVGGVIATEKHGYKMTPAVA